MNAFRSFFTYQILHSTIFYGEILIMEKRTTYHEQTDMENTLQLREVLKTLPGMAGDFFRAVSTTTSTSTRIKYAYDIRIFFQFLLSENPAY